MHIRLDSILLTADVTKRRNIHPANPLQEVNMIEGEDNRQYFFYVIFLRNGLRIFFDKKMSKFERYHLNEIKLIFTQNYKK